MKLKLISTKSHALPVDLALLVTRVVCGYAFVLHGWGKIQNPLSWMGSDSAIPSIFQALAAISEFGGGIAIAVGLLTRLGAFGLACTMGVAVWMHAQVFGDPFVGSKGGGSYELALVYFSIMLLILALGPGRFSVDRMVGR